jgi:hypothetical protein
MDGDPASFSSRYVQSFLLLKWLEKSFYQSLCQVRKGFSMQTERSGSEKGNARINANAEEDPSASIEPIAIYRGLETEAARVKF